MEPLRFDSTPEQIGRLQTILSGLGYTIDGEEAAARRAGAGTIRAVRSFQREHQLPIDDTYLVDQPMAQMLAKLATQRGLATDEPRNPGPRFTVEGTVKDRDGVPMPDLAVTVYDQDLRSRQRLGASVTDGMGHYSVEYGAENFQRAEKGYADIVVEIAAAATGQAVLYTSDVIFDAPTRLVHNIALDARTAAEFDRITKVLQPLLSPDKIAPREIDETGRFKDVGFLAGETGYSREQIADYAVAFRLANTTTLDASLLYALLRLDLWPDYALATVARTSDLDRRAEAIQTRFGPVTATQLRNILQRANDTNVVAASGDQTEKFIAAFLDYAARTPGPGHRLGLPLNQFSSLVSDFTSAGIGAHAAEATDGFDLVRRLRSDDNAPKQAVDKIEGIVKFAALSLNHGPLTTAVAGEVHSLDDVRRMATRTSGDWEQILGQALPDEHVPTFLAQSTAADQRATYAQLISTRLRQAFPTMAFVGDAGRDSEKSVPGVEALTRIVSETPAFELGDISIDRFLDSPAMRKNLRLEEREQIAAELKPLQRLYRVTKDYGAAKVLARASIKSAQDVYRRGEGTIVDILTADPGQSRRAAEAVYARGSTVYAATLQLAAESAALNSSSTTPALASNPIDPAIQLPNLEGLFQIGNDCACDDCRSVLSPAAYLADLLLYLENRKVNSRSAKDVLLSRRPDLSWIDLNCDNAFVPLPYVDICVEVLEDAVAPFVVAVLPIALSNNLPKDKDPGGAVDGTVVTALSNVTPKIAISGNAKVSAKLGDSWVLRDGDRTWRILDRGGADLAVMVLRNTHGTAAEREILPEYVNDAAYAAMAGKRFPWQLPIDLYGSEISGVLATIGVPRHELMRILKGPALPNLVVDANLAAARLGLSEDIATLLVKPDSTTVFTNWGVGSNSDAIAKLSQVPAFLKATGLHYDDLLHVLALPFVNSSGSLKIMHLDESCDLAQKRFDGLDAPALDRLHRFLRLTRALGLPLADVDLLVRKLATTATPLSGSNDLVAIADALRVHHALGDRPIDELVTLFGDMPTADIFDGMFTPLKPSLYARLFLDPAVFRPFDPAFAVDQVTGANPIAHVADHRGPIVAALRVAPEDLDKLLALANPATGVPFVSAALSIANISALFRHVTVANALGLSIEDWCTYVRLGGTDPFASPAKLLEAIHRIKRAIASPIGPSILGYILAADHKDGIAPAASDIAAALGDLRTALQRVDVMTDPTALPADRPGLLASIGPALLPVDSDPQRAARVADVLQGTFVARAVIAPAPAPVPQPVDKAAKLPFAFTVDGTSLVLSYTGLMWTPDQAILLDANQVGPIAGQQAYIDAINELFLAPRLSIRMARTDYSTTLAALPNGISVPPLLRKTFRYDAGKQQLLFHGVMTLAEQSQLLSLSSDGAYTAAVKALFALPRATVPANNVWLSDTDLAFPAANETAAQANDRIVTNLRKALTLLLPYTNVASSEDAVVTFAAGVTSLDRDAALLLLQKLAVYSGTPLQHLTDRPHFVQRTGPLTAANVQRAFQSYDLLHRGALVASRLGFKLREIDFIFTTGAAAGVLTFAHLPLSFTGAAAAQASLDALLALSGLVTLDKRTRAKSQHLLEFVTTAAPTTTVADLAQFAETALDWPQSFVTTLLATGGGLGIAIPTAAPLAATWHRLDEAVAAIRKVGLPASDVLSLTRPTPLKTDADLVRLAARARFGTLGFAAAMRPVENTLRHLKRDALTAYLLTYQTPTHPASATGNWDNGGDVFAYYLIDPEMNACQMTSRIVQAASTIQVFVQRAKMGLEPEISPYLTKDELWNQWDWMKAYRLWEANRQVFLFPENLLEPGFRKNKSPAFKALEDELMQGDITDESVKDAFLNYIDKLDEVSNLDITGIHWDDGNGREIGAAHVVGRTPGQEPHTYYYRKLTHPEDRWTAWEKIELDLKNAPAMPFLYEKRLHLLWPEFREDSPPVPGSVDVPKAGGGDPVKTLPAIFQYGVGLSENRHGKWTPKKVSKAMHPGREPLSDKAKDRVYWFPIDFLNQPQHAFYFIDDFYAKNDAMEFLGCRGYPENTTYRPVVYKTNFSRADLITSRDTEITNDGGDELIVSGNWTANNTHILKLTPGTFRITYPHHVTTFDRIGASASATMQMMSGQASTLEARPLQASAVTTGTRAPWIYGDNTKNFFVEPITVAPDGTQHNGSQLLDLMATEFARVKPDDRLSSLLFADHALFNNPGPQLRWSTFYHPLVCDFRGALLNGGIAGLMGRKTQFLSKPFNFEVTYGPHPIVLKPYPTEDVDFSDRGAYSLYNWELFFHSAFLIATQLSKNLRFEEALKWFHYIFDPTGGDGTDPLTKQPLAGKDTQRFWITRPFFEHTELDYRAQRIDNLMNLLASDPNDKVNKDAIADLVRKIASWRQNPFDAHLVASGRTVAYQKATVSKYVENLIAWGDSLFVNNALEFVLEAGSIYRYAKSIMGNKPQVVPPVGQPPVKTFAEIDSHLDAVGNTLVQLEDLMPVLPPIGPPQDTAQLPSLLFFCIPQNDKLMALWDIVDDRLDKFHRCLDLQGRPRTTSLFAPPIDPAQIMQALMGGAGLADLLANFDMPLSPYRFQTYLQKANELVGDLKAFGGAILGVLEKRDSEALSVLRQGHEIEMLNVSRDIKAALIRDAGFALTNLQTTQEMAKVRNRFYASREFMSSGESAAIDLTGASLVVQAAAMVGDTLGGVLAAIPDFNVGASGFGGTPHVTVKTGGLSFSKAAELAAKALSQSVGIIDKTAGMISTIAGYHRRFDDWQMQKDVTALEIDQYAAQIESARIRIESATRELANHDLQITHAKSVDEFLRTKYTNGDLYYWMIGEISKTYLATYRLAYAYAKMAEQHYRFELGIDTSEIIRFDAWDSLKKGLMSGERLQFDLRQLENAYLTENRRDFELTKHIALATAVPSALLALRRDGRCEIELPEELFDLDFPGHYFRRIKSVSLSIPCVTGPNTTIACTLRLIRSSVRVNTRVLTGTDGYIRKMRNSIPLDDDRFREMRTPVSAIATSSAQNDAGLFELNFRDERYLPFEGAGVVSRWAIELQTDGALRTFDYDTIADVILHIRYTAREDQGGFKTAAFQNVRNQLKAIQSRLELNRIFRVSQDFSAAWTSFRNPAPNTRATLAVTLDRERFTLLSFEGKLKLQGLQFSGQFSAKVTTAPSLEHDVSVPPLKPSQDPKIFQLGPDGDGYFKSSNRIPVESTVLAGNLDWSFHFREVGRAFEDFDPTQIEELYLIVSYTLE